MLPGFIIEEILKRERERARRDEQPRVELPVEVPPPAQCPSNPPPEDPDHDGERDEAIVTLDFD